MIAKILKYRYVLLLVFVAITCIAIKALDRRAKNHVYIPATVHARVIKSGSDTRLLNAIYEAELAAQKTTMALKHLRQTVNGTPVVENPLREEVERSFGH